MEERRINQWLFVIVIAACMVAGIYRSLHWPGVDYDDNGIPDYDLDGAPIDPATWKGPRQ